MVPDFVRLDQEQAELASYLIDNAMARGTIALNALSSGEVVIAAEAARMAWEHALLYQIVQRCRIKLSAENGRASLSRLRAANSRRECRQCQCRWECKQAA